MKNTLGRLVILLAWAPNILAAALPTDWKSVQTIDLPKPGVFRFSLPAATLEACRLGLEDLRLFDDRGRELPFLIERPIESRPPILPARNFKASQKAETTVLTMDTLTDRPTRALNLMTPADKFQKTVKLEGSTNGTTWTTLVQGEPIFRELSGTRRLLLEFPPAPYEKLRVTIDEPAGGLRISFSGAEIHTAPNEPRETELLNLTVVERENSGTATKLKLRSSLTSFNLADLEIQTSDPSFIRLVRLMAPARNGSQIQETEIWRDTIYRLPVADYSAAAKLNISPNLPVIGRDLTLVIDNNKQPPLNITGITAKRHSVNLIVLASTAGKHYLLSGNPSAALPSYDLAGLRGTVKPETIKSLAVSALQANPGNRSQPTASAADPNTGNWRYRKRLELTGGEIYEVELDLDILTHAQRSLHDLRITREGKVIPYAIQSGPGLNSVTPTVALENDIQAKGASVWSIKLPRAGLPLSQLECTTKANVFKRFMTLAEPRRDERGRLQNITLGSAEWIRVSDQEAGRLSMTIAHSPQTDRLLLTTENGNNPAIPLENFQCWYPRTFIVFKASPGAATYLYYGNADAVAPAEKLDLTQATSSASKTPAKLGPEEAVLVRQPLTPGLGNRLPR